MNKTTNHRQSEPAADLLKARETREFPDEAVLSAKDSRKDSLIYYKKSEKNGLAYFNRHKADGQAHTIKINRTKVGQAKAAKKICNAAEALWDRSGNLKYDAEADAVMQNIYDQTKGRTRLGVLHGKKREANELLNSFTKLISRATNDTAASSASSSTSKEKQSTSAQTEKNAGKVYPEMLTKAKKVPKIKQFAKKTTKTSKPGLSPITKRMRKNTQSASKPDRNSKVLDTRSHFDKDSHEQSGIAEEKWQRWLQNRDQEGDGERVRRLVRTDSGLAEIFRSEAMLIDDVITKEERIAADFRVQKHEQEGADSARAEAELNRQDDARAEAEFRRRKETGELAKLNTIAKKFSDVESVTVEALPAWIADTGSKQPPSNAPSVPTAQAESETRAQASAGLRAPASKTPQKAFTSPDQENRARSTPTAGSKPTFFGKVRNFFQSVGRFFSNLFGRWRKV